MGCRMAALAAGLVLTTSGCPSDGPELRLPADPVLDGATTAPPTTGTTATSPGPASLPRITRPAPAPATPTATTTQTSAPLPGTADLDGDGTRDVVQVAGATVTARLSTTGQVEAVALPAGADRDAGAEVLGRVDLDDDGVDEALVRTLALPAGDVRVVLRLGGSGLELLTTERGQPFELGLLVGMSGRRSYACSEADPRAGREVRVLDAERDGEIGPDMTFSGTVTTWSVTGSEAVVLGTERVEGEDVESPDLDLDMASCER